MLSRPDETGICAAFLMGDNIRRKRTYSRVCFAKHTRELAAHYATAVVPARPGHPKDKAVVEGLVRILMRY